MHSLENCTYCLVITALKPNAHGWPLEALC